MRLTDETTKLLEFLETKIALWRPAQPWAVAYSGGRDSGVLLWALVQVAGPGVVRALHVDHGWRPAVERASEGELVRAWCLTLGVPLTSFGPPGSDGGSEARARARRYSCFRSYLEDEPTATVWMGHHGDDQAETVLMRLLQGRSWQGLGGIPGRRGPFVRPFLELRAAALATVASEQSIPHHQDSTNASTSMTRNYLRHRVFPLLEARFPRAVASLGEFAETWAQVTPSATASPAWSTGAQGAEVASGVWAGWSGLQRQAELLAVANRIGSGLRLTRRFLETVCQREGEGRVEGAGWLWTWEHRVVRWERVVQSSAKEYFVLAAPGKIYDFGSHWMASGPQAPAGSSVLEFRAVDPRLPWAWRSAVAGMTFASSDDADWGKRRRRARLGTLDPSRRALAVQGGTIRAVVDLQTLALVWSETDPEKLNNPGIFVTLGKRSDYER